MAKACAICGRTIGFMTGRFDMPDGTICTNCFKEKGDFKTIAEWKNSETVKKNDYYKKCNDCGEVFRYSDKDVARNKELLAKVNSARKMAVMESFGGSRLASNQYTARADGLETQIIDYSKCPRCLSADVSEISADEFKATMEKQRDGKNTPISAADELKKFKELLDIGVITQEEFDAKKKQLLGL